MKEFLEDELDSFLDTGEFAETVTIDGVDVDAFFLEKYVEVTIGSTPIIGVRPVLEGKESDLSGKKGSVVVAGGGSYTIVAIPPNDTGMLTAILQDA